jgi:hypothetical protein
MLPGPGPLGTPPPSRPSYPRRDIWTGRTGVRPLPLRQGPEGLPCGLRTGGSAPSPTSYTLFPLAGNSRPPRHLRFFSLPLGFHRGCPGGEGKYGRMALVSGAGHPTTPGSPHPLTGSTPWPTRGPTRPRHRPPGESERMDEGIQKPDLEPLDREQGKRAFSGFLTPMVFQITPWVVGSAGRASHMRES